MTADSNGLLSEAVSLGFSSTKATLALMIATVLPSTVPSTTLAHLSRPPTVSGSRLNGAWASKRGKVVPVRELTPCGSPTSR
jgi:hypothetical protein